MNSSRLRVHYPTVPNQKIALRGDSEPFDWDVGQVAQQVGDGLWLYEVPASAPLHQWKPLLDDRDWSIGLNYAVQAGKTMDVFPFFQFEAGSLDTRYHFDTPIVTYLPPSYGENTHKRYPVLYIHDGQNLFDPETAFAGQTWGVHETLDRLIRDGEIDELIAVGIWNRGAGRIYDYTPSFDSAFRGVGAGGGADLYAKFIIEEIKPFIDQTYRTLPDAANCGLMGASLGGLASLYIVRRWPKVFSKVAAMSSSIWWNDHRYLKRVRRTKRFSPVKIYLDSGTGERWWETLDMFHALQDCGYRDGVDITCQIAEDHNHNEYFWGKRVHQPLTFLFPFGSTNYGAL